ncbi:MAG: hypothetical protein HY785_18405 [Oscillatoriophycideae cyanobacterium NC_groundwater_1537_Pr4_S-0.65um_50_18]|nr:hypothetical protein [Oscillatoriophycideae cyanobacterium NC_groundwater_1537_Pr4_S-0.65um_50_18]
MKIFHTISNFTQGIEAANLKLRLNGDRVRIEQKGRRLTLRATLPPKPGAKKGWHQQQYISLCQC